MVDRRTMAEQQQEMNPSEEQETAQQSPAEPSAQPSKPGKKSLADRKDSPVNNATWGALARTIVLAFCIGLGLAHAFRLSSGGMWLYQLLRNNKWPIDERNYFILESLALGVLLTGGALAFAFSNKGSRRILEAERWAWFLSPLMLLPALPVFLSARTWTGKHETLLPIVLFFGLISERLLSGALAKQPKKIQQWTKSLLRLIPARLFKKKKQLYLGAIIIAGLSYGLFMSLNTIAWHQMLGTATFDLGINNNLLYGGLHGRFNQSTVIFPEDPQKYLANHVKLGIYTFLPVYALFPRAETLLVIQSFSIGLGALPLFLFARRRLAAGSAFLLALCYLAYYPLHSANFYEMKIVPTSAALVLSMIWAVDAKRFKLATLFFLWALFMREDMPVPLAVIGAFFLLSGHRPRFGTLILLIASAWFILIRFKLMNDVGSWWFPKMYKDLWAQPERGFRSVVKTLLSNPTYVLKNIFVEEKFWYGLHLLVPLVFLPLRRWYLWAALVPGAILTLLVTNYAPPNLFSFQYVMHWAPYLFCAAALALSAINKEQGKARAYGALGAMVLCSLALTFNYGAFPRRERSFESGFYKVRFEATEQDRQNLKDVNAIVDYLPENASVATTEKIGAHLSSREFFYTLRRKTHGAEYLVARKKGLKLEKTARTLNRALESGEYGVDRRFGQFVVFKRGADTQNNAALQKEWRIQSAMKRASSKSRKKKK